MADSVPEETIKEMATTLISSRIKMEISKAMPASCLRLRVVHLVPIGFDEPQRLGLMRRPRPFSMTRRSRPLDASGSGAATISVIMTSRMFAGELSSPAPGQGTVGGGGDELSHV